MNGGVPLGALMRPALLDDESAGPESDCMVHVISTFNWHRGNSVASFWFASEVLEKMVSGGDDWDGYIWNTETWQSVLGPVSVRSEPVIDEKAWSCL